MVTNFLQFLDCILAVSYTRFLLLSRHFHRELQRWFLARQLLSAASPPTTLNQQHNTTQPRTWPTMAEPPATRMPSRIAAKACVRVRSKVACQNRMQLTIRPSPAFPNRYVLAHRVCFCSATRLHAPGTSSIYYSSPNHPLFLFSYTYLA